MNNIAIDSRYKWQVVINVEPRKYNFLLELLKSLNFVRIAATEKELTGDSRENIIANLQATANDLKLLKAGKLKTRPARELLNEL